MKKQDRTLDIQMGKNLKAERERLGMSGSEMAYHCQASTVTIWSWETGKAKIPLNALVRLIPHGFDPASIIPSPKNETMILQLVGAKDRNIEVEKHLVARCVPSIREVTEWEHMIVYHNLEWVDTAHPLSPGSLCLVDSRFIEDYEGEESPWDGTFLLHTLALDRFSLADFKPQSKNMVRFKAGGTTGKASPHSLEKATPGLIRGKVLGKVGELPLPCPPTNSHAEALEDAMKTILSSR